MRIRSRNIVSGLVLPALLGAFVGGCATTRDPIQAWQRGVAAYVASEGNGDPNALRDLPDHRARDAVHPSRVLIGQLAADAPRGAARDVQGVLVDHVRVGSHHWFVFLVAVFPPEKGANAPLDDIRLAAFCAKGDDLFWRVSRAELGMVDRYMGRGDDARDVRPAYRVFPFPSDRYRVTVSGDTIRVIEERSNAAWILSVPDGAGLGEQVADAR